jgi:hypothetical protein
MAGWEKPADRNRKEEGMSRAALILCCLVLAATAATAADIVTVPTANQLKAGEVDVAHYWIGTDLPSGAPTQLNFNTLYVGLTDKIEIDAHQVKLIGAAVSIPSFTIWNATILVLKEDQRNPNVVIGGRNLEGTSGFLGVKASWFVSAAKTVMAPVGGPPSLRSPVVRLHLSLGTEDETLFPPDKRHDGLFGGVQLMVDPRIGIVALHDSCDLITGITYTHKPGWPTIKGGTFGDHRWVGINYTFNVK